MQGWLPLFPLQVVLLPEAELPLHIFEDRYKEMIGEVLRDKLEFGVVLANEKGIVNTGCTATVERVLREYPDGRLDIMARGPAAVRDRAAQRRTVFPAGRRGILR